MLSRLANVAIHSVEDPPMIKYGNVFLQACLFQMFAKWKLRLGRLMGHPSRVRPQHSGCRRPLASQRVSRLSASMVRGEAASAFP